MAPDGAANSLRNASTKGSYIGQRSFSTGEAAFVFVYDMFATASKSNGFRSEGTCINYRLHLFGVPFSWQSQIQRWNPPEACVDTQRRGPYKLWVHTYRFHAQHGVTCIEDDVQYALPYWPFGELVYPLVRLQLARIFRYRQQAIRASLLTESG